MIAAAIGITILRSDAFCNRKSAFPADDVRNSGVLKLCSEKGSARGRLAIIIPMLKLGLRGVLKGWL